jgi:CxC2 like cysteine cluster associated with KDZ transposases
MARYNKKRKSNAGDDDGTHSIYFPDQSIRMREYLMTTSEGSRSTIKTTKGVTTTYEPRARLVTIDEMPSTCQPKDEEEPVSAGESQESSFLALPLIILTSVYTQSSAYFRQFESVWSELLEDVLSTEYDPAIGQICGCGSGALRLYRCTDSGCTGTRVQCKECLLQAHRMAPFHWAQEWNGRFFARRDLFDIGLEYTVGHCGSACPKAPQDDQGVRFTIVDVNGIHSTRLRFCYCFGSGARARQLTRARLFPATIEQPVTAFTFDVLKQFHIHSFESKKSVFDYVGALRRMTNNYRTELVPVSGGSDIVTTC